MIGIYKFTNKFDGKSYIGQSVDIQRRYNNHKTRSDIHNHFEETYFHDMIRHYGFDNFTFEVLEECSRSELDDREMYYIQKYNTLYPNGYNKTSGGNSPSHYQLSDEIYNGIIDDLLNSELSGLEIAKKYDVHFNTVYQMNLGNQRYDENLSYPLRKLAEKHEIYCCECRKPLHNKTKTGLCFDCYKKHIGEHIPNKETLFDLLSNNTFEVTARMFGVDSNSVRKWCKKYGFPYHASDYINNK